MASPTLGLMIQRTCSHLRACSLLVHQHGPHVASAGPLCWVLAEEPNAPRWLSASPLPRLPPPCGPTRG